MSKYLAVFAVLVWTSCNIAFACPVNTKTAPPALPPLLASGAVGGQLYYCMASTAPSTVGDLSPNEFAQYVQICNTSCSYQPMTPDMPHSLLIPSGCGPGWHDLSYQVQPPPVPKPGPGTLQLKMVSSSCKALTPSKGEPPPSPAPASRGR